MFEYSSVSASSYDPAALVAKLNEAAADGWDVVSIVPTGGDVSAFLRREGSTSEDEIAAEDGMVAAVLAEEAVLDEELAEEAAVLDEELAEEAVLDEELADDAAAQEWSAGDTAALAVLADGEAGASTDTETTAAEVVETVEVTEVPQAEETAEEAAIEEPAGWAVAPESPADTAKDTADEIPVVAAAAVIEPVAEPVPVETEPVAEPSPAPAPEPAPVPPPEPTPAVSTPAGWYPDPSTRYELRYWDGTQWTEHVARQGQQFTDPPVR
ncbi:MAG TPA: DUF2510 domain-containing protein [Acidimicrobiales bacterium]|nr:DUF2510 domain-containing protein [Acidimicrobiales bacterium]